MTDFRALCVELTDALDKLNCSFNVPNQSGLVERVSAALAEPEPEPVPEVSTPSDEELMDLAVAVFDDPFATDKDYARAVLARWGK